MGFSPQIMDDKLDPWCFLGGFQELRINPHFLKTSCICFCICFQLADQQIRHLSSGKSFQKMRINPQFLKTNPKSDQSLKKMPPWRPKNYFFGAKIILFTHQIHKPCVFCKKLHSIWSNVASTGPLIIYIRIQGVPTLYYISPQRNIVTAMYYFWMAGKA